MSAPIMLTKNHIVNDNPTRYKVELTAIYVKDNHYDVIYDSTQFYYIAYEEQGIQFVRYDKLQDFLKPYIKKQDSWQILTAFESK